MGYKSYKGKIAWKLAPVAVLWVIWLERNRHTFQGTNTQDIEIVDVVSKITQWATSCKEFNDYDPEAIMRS